MAERVVDFADRVAVVTGAASGIGLGMARAFSRAGCRVVLADVDEPALHRAAADVGGLAVVTDVSDAASVDALADRTMAEHGAVHVVCNNAGVGPFGAFRDMSLADWRWLLDVNLWGVVHGVHTFLPLLERNSDWGHIVNTSSMSVMITSPETAAYVASKAAVLGLTEVLHAELVGRNSLVGATALIPGTVSTNIRSSLRHRQDDAGGSGLREVNLEPQTRHKGYRWMHPDEVGELVVDAVRRNTPYLLTHPELAAAIRERGCRMAGDPDPSV